MHDWAMSGRRAGDDEVSAWQTDGWVVLHDLVDTDVIDAAAADLWTVFPKPDKFHDDPARYIPRARTRRHCGAAIPRCRSTVPWFRPDQHRWGHEFPFMGSGALNRLYVHPGDRRLRRTRRSRRATSACTNRTSSARYTGDADYEQPMHTDRNHSFLPSVPGPPWWHVEMFVYLTDVDDDCAPTHAAKLRDSTGRSTNDVFFPENDPELVRGRNIAAVAKRGSVLAYRNEVFHRGVDITRPRGSRFLLTVVVQGRPTSTGSITTPCSRNRRIRAGRASSKGRHRGSWSCSASRRPAIRCGPTPDLDARRFATRTRPRPLAPRTG